MHIITHKTFTIEGLESTQGRAWVTHVWAFSFVMAQHHSFPLQSERTSQTGDVWVDLKKKQQQQPFFDRNGGPASRHQPTLPLPQSGPRTETCRNCENHLLSQVLSLVFVFVFVFRSESVTEWPEERREAGSEWDMSCAYFDYFLLNNFARWTFTLLIVLEVFFVFLFFL